MRIVSLLMMAGLLAVVSLQAESRSAEEVFGKWLSYQKIFKDCSLNKSEKDIRNTWQGLVSNYKKYCQKDAIFDPFLNSVSNNCLCQNGALNKKGTRSLCSLYQWFDHDIAGFLNYLKNHDFIDSNVNMAENGMEVDPVINRYKRLTKQFFVSRYKDERMRCCFALANRMFEYCYGEKTFDDFYTILKTPDQHQIARLFYSIMWFHLVGEGWKHWHDDCLKRIAQEANRGKEIVYIAGGTDIYQLLEHGIYNIRVIDPMLPSQPLYYSEGWDWLVKSNATNRGIGDEVPLSNVTMKRSDYKENGSFNAHLSTDKDVQLPLSITEWQVYDNTTHKKCGKVIFERRFCQTSDFTLSPKKAFLISFNEMYYVAIPSNYGGWGIGAESLPKKLSLHVKQLRKPVTQKVLLNIARGEDCPLTFIRLGSCAT